MNVHHLALCVFCLVCCARSATSVRHLASDDTETRASVATGAQIATARSLRPLQFARQSRSRDTRLVNITLPPEPIADENKKLLARAAFMMLRSSNASSSRPTTIAHSAADFLRFKRKKERCRTKRFQQVVEHEGCTSKTVKLNLCIGQCKSVFIPKGTLRV